MAVACMLLLCAVGLFSYGRREVFSVHQSSIKIIPLIHWVCSHCILIIVALHVRCYLIGMPRFQPVLWQFCWCLVLYILLLDLLKTISVEFVSLRCLIGMLLFVAMFVIAGYMTTHSPRKFITSWCQILQMKSIFSICQWPGPTLNQVNCHQMLCLVTAYVLMLEV